MRQLDSALDDGPGGQLDHFMRSPPRERVAGARRTKSSRAVETHDWVDHRWDVTRPDC